MNKRYPIEVGTEVFTTKEVRTPHSGGKLITGTGGHIVAIEKTREGFWFKSYPDGGPILCLMRNEIRTRKQQDAFYKRKYKKI